MLKLQMHGAAAAPVCRRGLCKGNITREGGKWKNIGLQYLQTARSKHTPEQTLRQARALYRTADAECIVGGAGAMLVGISPHKARTNVEQSAHSKSELSDTNSDVWMLSITVCQSYEVK